MLTWYHVVTFPVVASLMLLVLFYFFEYIQFVYILLTVGESIESKGWVGFDYQCICVVTRLNFGE